MYDFVLQPDLEVKNCSCWKSMVLPPSPPVLPGSLFDIFGRESPRMRLRLQGHVFVYRHVVSRAQNSKKNEHTRKITCTTNMKIPSDNCLNTKHWMHVGVAAQEQYLAFIMFCAVFHYAGTKFCTRPFPLLLYYHVQAMQWTVKKAFSQYITLIFRCTFQPQYFSIKLL